MRFILGCLILLIPTAVSASLQICPRMPVATATSHQFLTSINAAGQTTLAQPAFTDISGNLTNGQLPTAETWPSSGTVQATTPNVHGVLISGSGATATVLAPDASTTKVLTSGGTGADPTWSAAGTGTVTSVTFTGDGVVDSATPSTAVTSSGTVTATIINQAKNTFLAGPTSGSNAAPTFRSFASADMTAPTVQTLISNGTQTGWLFTISTSSTVAVGDTYTNNSNTYTVQGALSAQSGQVLFMSGTGATSGTTLTRSTGSGTSSITFSTKLATATYTTPTSPRVPVYLKIKMAGGGGGGGGSGTSAGTAPVAGNHSYFGANILLAAGGQNGINSTAGVGGGNGGACTITSPATGLALAGGQGGNSGSQGSGTIFSYGATGGGNAFGGAGAAGPANAGGSSAQGNTGGGGGGAGGPESTAAPGSGGGAGGYCEAIITNPISSYPYIIGSGGSGGAAGSTGFAGGGGAAGVIFVEEHYQ